MLQAKEGGETSCAEVYGFSLFPSAVLLWAEQSAALPGAILQRRALPSPTEGFFPCQKELFLVYHSFC